MDPEKEKAQPRFWALTHSLWATSPSNHVLARRLYRGFRAFFDLPLALLPLFLAAAAPLSVIFVVVTFTNLFGVYSIVALVSLGAVLTLLSDFIARKLGYAHNFDGWDFPLKRALFLPVGFLLSFGLIYFLLLLRG